MQYRPVIPIAVDDNSTKTGKTTPPTIDLTGDEDEELNRAMAMSMEDQGTTFGPSDRAPNPEWAMVPSNVLSIPRFRYPAPEVLLPFRWKCGVM